MTARQRASWSSGWRGENFTTKKFLPNLVGNQGQLRGLAGAPGNFPGFLSTIINTTYNKRNPRKGWGLILKKLKHLAHTT